MVFLLQHMMLYAVPLMIVALAGVCAERSGVINLALEGIMIFGAFMGVVFVRVFQGAGWTQDQGQLIMLISLILSGLCGIAFSMLLAFSAINLKADQTIGPAPAGRFRSLPSSGRQLSRRYAGYR